MADQSPDNLRGFLHPWPLSIDELWSAQSSYTEQSTIAGAADADQASNLIVTTSGTQDGEADITITTAKGGTPGNVHGGTFTWRPTAGSNEYGWDNPGSVTGWNKIRWAGGGNTYKTPDAITLSDGTLIIASGIVDGLNDKLVIYRQTATETGFTQKTITTETAVSFTLNFEPGLCLLPNEDILIFSWNELDNDLAQVRVHISKDKGLTWNLLNPMVLNEPVSTHATTGYTPGRIRAAANADQVVIFARMLTNNAGASIRENMIQLASSNLGASFVTVAISSTQIWGYPDVFVDLDGKFKVAAILASNQVGVYTLPHAFFSLSSLATYANQTLIVNGVVPATFASNAITDGGLTIWQDPDGTMYACVKDISNNIWYLKTSRDNGATWAYFQNVSSGSSTPKPIFDAKVATTTIKNPCGLTCRGHQLLIHEHVSTSTTADESLSAFVLGGYGTRTMPGLTTYPNRLQRVGFTHTYVPFDKPQDTGLFTSAGSGVTESVSNGYLQLLDGSGGGTITYSATPTATIDQGLIVRARVSSIQGSGTNHRAIRLRLADGTKHYEISIRIFSASIDVFDHDTSSAIGAATVDLSSSSASLLIFMHSSKVFVYFQPEIGNAINSLVSDLRNFAVISGTVSNAGGGTTGNQIKFGHLSAPSSALETYWHEFLFTAGADTGKTFTLTDYFDSAPISAREYPSIGFYAWVDGGLSISTKDGPAFKGESYKIRRSSKHPITNVFFKSSPSPRVKWRSNQVANPTSQNITEVFLPFQLDISIGAAQETKLGSDMAALHLSGVNFKDSTLERYDVGTTSWVNVATINGSEKLSNTFIRKGSTVLYGGAGSTDFYLHMNEAKNWRILLDDGAGNVVWRKVEFNTEGLFGNTAHGKKAIIKIIDGASTDPAAGTLWLLPESLTVIVNTRGETGAAWGLRISAQKTLEGDARIGSLLFGSMAIQAPQYSRGRSISWNPNIEMYEQMDNTIRPSVRSQGKRTISISWSEGADTRNFYADTLNAMDYWKGSGSAAAEAIANVGDVAQQMTGLYQHLLENNHPTVYLPKIKYASSAPLDVQIFNRNDDHLYCIPSGEITSESVLGDELKDEIFRVSSVNLTEIV